MDSNLSLMDSLKSHNKFFQMFIEMIPKEIYRGNEEDDELVNPRYFKHRKEPLTLDEKKLMSRKRKLEKYSLSGVSNYSYQLLSLLDCSLVIFQS